MIVDGPEGGCHGGEAECGWILGGGLVILRGPALTHVSSLYGRKGQEGEEEGGERGWWLVAALGPWGAGIDLLGPPSPPGISPRPR